MKISKVEPRHENNEVQDLRFSCKGREGLVRNPMLVYGGRAQYVLGEYGNVFEFLDGGPEDALSKTISMPRCSLTWMIVW
jgi:hypothetical protein